MWPRRITGHVNQKTVFKSILSMQIKYYVIASCMIWGHEGRKENNMFYTGSISTKKQPTNMHIFVSLIENIFKDEVLLRTQRNTLQITRKSKWEAIHSLGDDYLLPLHQDDLGGQGVYY